MRFRDLGEGVLVHGTYALSVYQDIGNLIAGVGRDDKGLAAIFCYGDAAAGIDGAALGSGRIDDVPLCRIPAHGGELQVVYRSDAASVPAGRVYRKANRTPD